MVQGCQFKSDLFLYITYIFTYIWVQGEMQWYCNGNALVTVDWFSTFMIHLREDNTSWQGWG